MPGLGFGDSPELANRELIFVLSHTNVNSLPAFNLASPI